MGRRLPSNWDPHQWTRYSCQRFEDVCLQVCGSPFYLDKKQKIFPKKVEKSKIWFQVWLQSWLPSSWREGDNCLWHSYIWHLTIICFTCHLQNLGWWMFEGFLLCRWLLEPRKTSRLCKWVHTTQESAILHPSVMHNAHFIRSSTRPLLYDFNAAFSSSPPSAQGTHATRPRCLTSPMERLSACLVELSTGALSTISYTDIQGSWWNMVSVNLSIFYPPIDDGLNCRYRCNEGVPMSGSESLYCDGNSWNGSVR